MHSKTQLARRKLKNFGQLSASQRSRGASQNIPQLERTEHKARQFKINLLYPLHERSSNSVNQPLKEISCKIVIDLAIIPCMEMERERERERESRRDGVAVCSPPRPRDRHRQITTAQPRGTRPEKEPSFYSGRARVGE